MIYCCRAEREAMIKIERLTEDGFRGLKEGWNTLLDKSRDRDNIFRTWEWQYNWWEVYGKDKSLFVLAVKNEKGALVGIAPLYKEVNRLFGLFKVKEIRLLGSGEVCSDHLDYILEKEYEHQAIEAIFNYLSENRQEWDVIHLEALSKENNILLEDLSFSRNGFLIKKGVFSTLPYIDLSSEGYLERLSSSRRYYIRRKEKAISRQYDVCLLSYEEMKDSQAAFDTLIRLHSKRWKDRDIAGGSFSSGRFNAFHRRMVEVFGKSGNLRLDFLKADDSLVAGLYGFCKGDRFFYYQAGFDEAWEKYSVGVVLMAACIKKMIREGVKEFDFLRGEDSYKFDWTDKQRENLFITVIRKSLVGRLYLLQQGCVAIIRKVVKVLLPEPVLNVMRKMVYGGRR